MFGQVEDKALIMKKHKYIVRVFECTQCHKNMYAPKRVSKITSNKHVKTMFCPFCHMDTQFIQIDTI